MYTMIDEKKTIAITKRYLKQYPRLKTIHKKTSLTCLLCFLGSVAKFETLVEHSYIEKSRIDTEIHESQMKLDQLKKNIRNA